MTLGSCASSLSSESERRRTFGKSHFSLHPTEGPTRLRATIEVGELALASAASSTTTFTTLLAVTKNLILLLLHLTTQITPRCSIREIKHFKKINLQIYKSMSYVLNWIDLKHKSSERTNRIKFTRSRGKIRYLFFALHTPIAYSQSRTENSLRDIEVELAKALLLCLWTDNASIALQYSANNEWSHNIRHGQQWSGGRQTWSA